MFFRMLDTYLQSGGSLEPILFDRGNPDILDYAALFGFDFPSAEKAALLYRYKQRVFAAREQIYCTDEERTVRFSLARELGDIVRTIYERFGYTLIDLPCVCVQEREEFVLSHIGAAA